MKSRVFWHDVILLLPCDLLVQDDQNTYFEVVWAFGIGVFGGHVCNKIHRGHYKKNRFVRGLLGTGPPDPTLESASPSPPQRSIWHRFNIEIGSNQEIDVESMSNRCQIDVESMPNRPMRRGG